MTTSQFEQAVQLLRSKDPTQRRRAITWLAQSKDENALRPLLWAYRNESDAELRDLALRGGRYVKKVLDDQKAATGQGAFVFYGGTTATDARDELGSLDDDGGGYRYGSSLISGGNGYADDGPTMDEPDDSAEVSSRDAIYARTLLSQAVDHHLRGEREAALRRMAKAVQTDLSVRNEPMFANTAAELTGMAPDEAARMFRDSDALENFLSRKFKTKRGGGASSDEKTWGDVFIDLGLYTLVNLVGTGALVFLGADQMRRVLALPEMRESIQNSAALAQFQEVLNSEGMTFLVLGALVAVLSGTVNLLIQNYLVHFASVTFLNGEGNTTDTLGQLIPFQTVVALLGWLAGVPLLLWSMSRLLTNANLQGDAEMGIGILVTVGSVIVLGTWLLRIWEVALVAKAHNFGWLSGCGALIAGGFIYGVLSSILSCVFNLLLAAIGS